MVKVNNISTKQFRGAMVRLVANDYAVDCIDNWQLL